MLRFTLGGVEHDFDDDALDIEEACEVKRHTGLGVREFILGIRTGDPLALRAMMWLALRRTGETLLFTDVRGDFYAFMASLHRPGDESAETGGQAEDADPTAPEPGTSPGSDAGPTPLTAVPATSEPWPST
ncbi:MAG: hypothetical protein ABR559_07745 [Gemmatimonadota bacterium]